jgi:Ca-activated chloride channel family protein
MTYAHFLISLAVALLAAIIVFFIFYSLKPQTKKLMVFNTESLKLSKNLAVLYNFLFGAFAGAGLLFLFLALARPQEKKLEPKTSEKGLDILFALDISDSMLIEDMKPHENRLESAKHHIKEFIKNRPFDRLGLVIFSGEAYTRVPLTVDKGLLLQNLSDVEVSDYMKKGTAIGVALAASANRIKDSESASKVIVLLTDGENNTGVIDPLTALDLTADLGAKVYTLGIGRDGRSMLPVFTRDRFGRKIKSYRPFPTKINEKLLKEIAFKTGGRFYRASEESDMSAIFNEIDALETTKINLPDTYRVVELFQTPLRLSLFCFVVLALFELGLFWRGV